MRDLQLLFSLVFAVVFASSCNLSDDEKDTIVKVNPEFYLSMFEVLGANPQFQFHLETFAEHDCLNSVIDNSIVTQPPHITLFIKDVETLSDCNPGLASATGIASPGRLPIGSYDLLITLKNAVESTGKLTLYSDRYELAMSTSNGIETTHNTLYRIPSKTIWGYVAYDDPTAVGDAPQQFLADLQPMTEPSGLNDGYFGHLTITNGKISELHAPPVQAFVEPFHFRLASSLDSIQGLLEEYRSTANADSLKIKVYTWEGTEL